MGAPEGQEDKVSRVLDAWIRMCMNVLKCLGPLVAYRVIVRCIIVPLQSNSAPRLTLIDWIAAPICVMLLAAYLILSKVLSNRRKRESLEAKIRPIIDRNVDPSIRRLVHSGLAWGLDLMIQSPQDWHQGWTINNVAINLGGRSTQDRLADETGFTLAEAKRGPFQQFTASGRDDHGKCLMLTQNPSTFTSKTTLSLDVAEIEERYVDFYREWVWTNPCERSDDIGAAVEGAAIGFPNCVCLNLIVKTADRRILKTKELGEESTMGFSLQDRLTMEDVSCGPENRMSHWICRALREQLGVAPTQFSENDIRVLGVSIEADVAKCCIIAVVNLNIMWNELLETLRLRQKCTLGEPGYLEPDDLARQLFDVSRSYQSYAYLSMLTMGYYLSDRFGDEGFQGVLIEADRDHMSNGAIGGDRHSPETRRNGMSAVSHSRDATVRRLDVLVDWCARPVERTLEWLAVAALSIVPSFLDPIADAKRSTVLPYVGVGLAFLAWWRLTPLCRKLLDRVVNRPSRLAALYEASSAEISTNVDPSMRQYLCKIEKPIAWGLDLMLQSPRSPTAGWDPEQIIINWNQTTLIMDDKHRYEYESYLKDRFLRAYVDDSERVMISRNEGPSKNGDKLALNVRSTKWSQLRFFHECVCTDPAARHTSIQTIIDGKEITFPNSLCLYLVVATSDGTLVTTKTSHKVAYYPGKWDFTIGEQLNVKDLEPNLRDRAGLWVRRALREEMSIDPEQYDPKAVRFLGVSLEGDLANVCIISFVKLNVDWRYLDALLETKLRVDWEFDEWLPVKEKDLAEQLLFPSREYHPSAYLDMLAAGYYIFGVAGFLSRMDRAREHHRFA